MQNLSAGHRRCGTRDTELCKLYPAETIGRWDSGYGQAHKSKHTTLTGTKCSKHGPRKLTVPTLCPVGLFHSSGHRGTTWARFSLRVHQDCCKSLGSPSTTSLCSGTFAQAQWGHRSHPHQDFALQLWENTRSLPKNIFEEAEPGKGKEKDHKAPAATGNHRILTSSKNYQVLPQS